MNSSETILHKYVFFLSHIQLLDVKLDFSRVDFFFFNQSSMIE